MPGIARVLTGAWLLLLACRGAGLGGWYLLTLPLHRGGFYDHHHGPWSWRAVSLHTELWHYLFRALTSLLQTVGEMQPEWQISLIMLLHSSSLCYI